MRTVWTLLVFVAVLWTNAAMGQQGWCGTKVPQIDPAEHEAFEGYYQTKLLTEGASLKKKTTYIIPVVVHIIHEGGAENVPNERVIGLINRLNQDFSLSNPDTSLIRPVFRDLVADVGIEFRLARVDPKGNCTNGITRTWSAMTNQVEDYGENDVKPLIKWNKDRYLNIWVVKSIKSDGKGITLGYAYYPGAGNEYDGIVIRYDQMTSATLTHEVGHYLNLRHTFDAGCNNQNDLVDDTPPVEMANYGCPLQANSCTADWPDLPDQVENHMDYSNCRVMFTKGQKTRMLAALYYYRRNLYSEDNLIVTGVASVIPSTLPIIDFSITEPYICPGQAVRLSNATCSHDTNTAYSWILRGNQTLTSTHINPVLAIDSSGLYSVELTVSNGDWTETVNRNDAILVADTTKLPEVLNVDFDFPLGAPDDWLLTQYGDLRWTNTYHGYSGGNCLFVNNYEQGVKGMETALHLPPVSLYKSKDPYLRYQVAHAKSNGIQDVLSIFISIDCGETWQLVRQDNSSRLYTSELADKAFYPKHRTNWRDYSVDLSRFIKHKGLLAKIVFWSGGGNNLFIDNIRLGTEAISIYESPDWADVQVHVYPNPSSGLLTLECIGANMEGLEILDHTGRQIASLGVSSSPSKTVADLQHLAAGYYIARVKTDKGMLFKQLVIN